MLKLYEMEKYIIKFRALKHNGFGWAYGSYFNGFDWADFIIENEGFENRVRVIPETVGQLHNALTKKAGVEVYVGDKIKYRLAERMGFPKSDFKECIVKTVEYHFHYYIDVEVIGNIHEK